MASPKVLAVPVAFNEEKKIGSVLKRFEGASGFDEVRTFSHHRKPMREYRKVLV